MLRLWIGCLALLLAACGGAPPRETASATPPAGVVDEISGATITGKVVFAGSKPAPVVIDMSASPMCARTNTKAQATTEVVVVNDSGTLCNVFVWVKAGLPSATWAPPAAPAVLDQNGCIYKPHVQGVMVGQQLEIRNSDLTNHNVHSLAASNEGWNVSQPPRAEALFRTFAAEEVMVPFKCNVHPWMKAYIGVVAHPFFAVTGEDGTFTIKGLPPGTYTIEAWHEKYGARQRQVAVGAGESKAVEFSIQGKG